MNSRCVNIDWLECYCLESSTNFPHDAEYFKRLGLKVNRRDYGTRQYEEMFVVCDMHDNPFIEVRRKPVSGSMAKRVKGIFSPFSCHLKLVNRYCYADNCVALYAEFLRVHGYSVQRLFRLDICYDFEKFDDNTDPNKFVKRYLSGKYTKVNQGNIAAHGSDRWEGRDWHSLSWGAAKSMVSTKLYLKTLELQQAHDKPYIRFAWQCAGLVDDYDKLLKVGADGKAYTPKIWRLEFSIKSSAKGWVVLEDNNGKHTQKIEMEHDLDTYDTKEKQFAAFQMLCRHYFHFKYYEEGVRKDLCKDRVLFKFEKADTIYSLSKLLTERPKDPSISALRVRIERYRNTHFDDAIRKACDIILKALESESIRDSVPTYDRTEAQLLQQLIVRRMQHPDEPYTYSLDVVNALLSLSDDVF